MLIYFRVLKKAQPNSPLLQPTLAGLSRHAHRISIGFLGDLIVVLQRLLGSDQLSDESALHCALTAFAVMQGDGSALTVDLKDFYTLIYNRLTNLAARTNPDLITLTLKALQHILIERKQLSVARVAAFGKRAAELAVASSPPTALALLQLLKTLVVVRVNLDLQCGIARSIDPIAEISRCAGAARDGAHRFGLLLGRD